MISACCWLTRRLIPKVLKTSDTCSQPEPWHSCSSSSVDPLQWTQPGPSRWRRFLIHKSNDSATAGEKGSLLPTWQPQHCYSWDRAIFSLTLQKLIVNMLLEYIYIFFYLKIVWTSLSMQHFLRELLLTLLSAQRCFISSLHLFCSITKTETLLRVGWKIL